MSKRSETTRLMVDSTCVLQKTMEVLYDPEQGVAMFTYGYAVRIVAL